MKIWVGYWEDPHQGCGPPVRAFATEAEAREWLGQHGQDYTYTELELDLPPIDVTP